MMMESSSLLEKAIARIVEMSADLHIQRLRTTQYSLEFHDYTVRIAAYGKVLALLTRLQQQDECAATFGLLGSLGTPREPRASF